MIIEFSVENYRSIKELQTISFVAAPLRSKKEILDIDNTFKVNEKLLLLKSVGIYGSNSSGKSNLIKAMMQMLFIVRDVMSDERILDGVEPFLMDNTSDAKPTFFQIQFLLKGKLFRYGFEVNKNEIISEWLYGMAEKSETYYFERSEKGKIKVNQKYFAEGLGLEKRVKKTNLYLNVVDALNGNLSAEIKNYLENSIAISLGVSGDAFRTFSLKMLDQQDRKSDLLNFLSQVDINIKDILTFSEDSDELNNGGALTKSDKQKIRTHIVGHRAIKADNPSEEGVITYLFEQHESEGTKKLFDYAGALILALKLGKLIVIDEFDARLHPILTKKILSMFHSSEINKKGAQLLFVTHDTHLLSNEILRRDQVYFAEKDSKGRTEFYSLYDIKGVRNDASYEKDYIKGRYGAIPFVGDLKLLFDE